MKKILLIDDDKKGILTVLKDELNERGFKVTSINDADNVFEELKNNKYQTIILDIMLPVPESWTGALKKKCDNGEATGIVLYQLIRKEFPTLPILVYSVTNFKKNKGDKYTSVLKKPEFTDKIIEELEKLISKSLTSGEKNN